MFLTVSWFTTNTVYEGIIEKYLIPSLNKLNLERKIYGVPSKKQWQANTNLKPYIIEMALGEINKDILLIDADSTVNEYPALLDTIPEEFDIGLFYLPWKQWYKKDYEHSELCSGTMFFRNTPAVTKLIDKWKALCDKNLMPDQNNLEIAVKGVPELKIYQLPIEYCWIHTLPDGSIPTYPRPEHVVIEHYQASRDIKNSRSQLL